MDTSQIGHRFPDLEDEDELELPRHEGSAKVDDDSLVDEDAEVEVASPAGDEVVGLDAAVGLDEPLEGEIEASEDAESTQWTVGSDEARDLEADPDLLEGEEYGWTDANEPSEEIDLGADLDDELPERASVDDRGEEGPVEAAEDVLDATGVLPPLDADAEEPADDEPFALDVLREVTGGLPDEPERLPDG